MLSSWYTRKELALRTAVLYSGLVIATAFSGLIAAGIFAGLSDTAGLHGWQWLFILEGAGSVVAAIFAFILLPDFPESTTGSQKWLLTDKERQVAIQRIALDRVSLPETDRSVWHGLGLAVKDVRTWIFVSTEAKRWMRGKVTYQCFTGRHLVRQSHRIWIQQLLPYVSSNHCFPHQKH